MPSQKDLKRLVRTRMKKTGESYTSARAQIVSSSQRPIVSSSSGLIVSSSQRPGPTAAAPDYAKLAGMSDAAIEAKTGCTWEKWVWALDAAGAADMSHRAIADIVHGTYKVPGWWTQAVTVGYERIKGLREIGQRRSGEYEASRSKTFAVPVARLFQAFSSTRIRNRWLPGVKLTIRKATPERSIRISWKDGTSVEVWFVKKGEAKSAAQVTHRKLTSQKEIALRKAWWGERLSALAEALA